VNKIDNLHKNTINKLYEKRKNLDQKQMN